MRTGRLGSAWAWASGAAGVTLFAALLLLPPLSAAQMGPAATIEVRGNHDQTTLVRSDFAGNFTLDSISVVNNVTYLTATTIRTLTGNMSGVLLAYEWGAVQANGSAWISGSGTFVGTIHGSSAGVISMSWHRATGTFGVSVSGEVRLFDGQKGLNGMHGSGVATVDFTGGASFDGTYSLHLDLH